MVLHALVALRILASVKFPGSSTRRLEFCWVSCLTGTCLLWGARRGDPAFQNLIEASRIEKW